MWVNAAAIPIVVGNSDDGGGCSSCKHSLVATALITIIMAPFQDLITFSAVFIRHVNSLDKVILQLPQLKSNILFGCSRCIFNLDMVSLCILVSVLPAVDLMQIS